MTQHSGSDTRLTKRAGVYVRVSGSSQVEGTSHDSQEEQCAAVATARGWKVAEVYKETWTGTVESRRELNRLLADCEAGLIDVCIVFKWDRWARGTEVGLQLAKRLDELGIALVVVAGEVDTTTPEGRFMRTMFLGYAEMERDQIVERMARGQRKKAESGRWPAGIAPFGYRLEGKGRDARPVIDEREWNVIRTAVDLIVDQGFTTGEACRRLNALGMTPRKARQWEHMNLSRMLRSRALIGRLTWAKQGPYGRARKGHHTTGRHGPPIEFQIEPLLTVERFQQLQDALDRRATGPRRSNGTYPLSGRLFGQCGGKFTGFGQTGRRRQYRCKGHQWPAKEEEKCSDGNHDAEQVEQLCWREVLAFLIDPARLARMEADYYAMRVAEIDVRGDALGLISKRIAALERARTETVAEYLAANLPAVLVKEAVEKVESDLAAARLEMAELEAWGAESHREASRLREVGALAKVARKRLQNATLADIDEVFRLLDVRVRIVQYEPSLVLEVEGRVFPTLLSGALARDLGNGVPKCSTCCRP